MRFSIFLPPRQVKHEKSPAVYWLSGLTCTDENFSQKSGAQRVAAALGLALVVPDTSPRGAEIPDDPEGAFDLGLGAGFYVNATEEPWRSHYRMYDYVVKELPELVEALFPINDRRSISGHSMGGHGALMIALKNPERYCSVSAFAPIVSPLNCPWGQKAFTLLLGNNQEQWKKYDTCELINNSEGKTFELLIDQGTKDIFLEEQLKPDLLQKACKNKNYPLNLRWQEGYDHGYGFIASFLEDHFKFHGEVLERFKN